MENAEKNEEYIKYWKENNQNLFECKKKIVKSSKRHTPLIEI